MTEPAANDERDPVAPDASTPIAASAATGGWPAPLAADWQDYLTSELVRGTDPSVLLPRMREAGFDEGYARVAISVVRSMTDRVQQQNPAMLGDYVADRIRLDVSAGAVQRAADREVRLSMVLANPNVVVIEDLLSLQECEQLIRMAQGKLRRSEVVDPSGRLEISGVRRSEGAHFAYGENAVVARLEARISALTGVPIPHGEPLQLLHYPAGGEYEPHHDYFDPAFPGTATLLKQGGQRVATVIVYLHEPDEGGGTNFPELELSVRPRRGSAIYFEYHNAQGQLDARCLHAGMPVVRGHKWIATKWLRQAPYANA